MSIDTALVGALHVDYLKKRDLGCDERAHHTLFQSSTIDALLEGNTTETSASRSLRSVEIWV